MKEMETILERVREEMEDAAEYAELALSFKAENPAAAKLFETLSEQERGHAQMLLQEAGNLCKGEADKAIYGYEKDVMGRKDAGLRQKWERFKEHA